MRRINIHDLEQLRMLDGSEMSNVIGGGNVPEYDAVGTVGDFMLTRVVGSVNHGTQGTMGIYGEAGYFFAK